MCDVTKSSVPMRNKSQRHAVHSTSKTAPEWAPVDLMIDRHDPCTVQPACLFLAFPFPRPSWPQFKTSTYQSTSLRHLSVAVQKKISLSKKSTPCQPRQHLDQTHLPVDIIDRPTVPGCERRESARERGGGS